MYQNIVIGYDGSDRSEDALVLGCRLAAATHARVTIACAYAGIDQVRGAVEASGEAFTGSPAKVLAREAEAEALDLLVTGSRG